ncbi:MAG: recombinase family protein [Candidatus Saccharimonadales bacterium]
MSKLPPLAITTCRVSSDEQLKNHSLQRQAKAVKQAAKELGAIIPLDGQWSGSVSSKAGTNVMRKDLKEMIAYVQRHPRVKYLIVHEVDRFMRSVSELFYFEVTFELYGVKVWYASQPELNTNNHQAKLLKALEVFKAEGSNVERIQKSIDGLTDALRLGRYPFKPPTGYRKGYKKGVPEVDDERGRILQKNLLRLYAYKDPSQALKELNESDFTKGYAKLKMDKYRHYATNIFYAGAVKMNKQVHFVNLNGKHEALITLEQHNEIVRIFEKKKKNQTGPNTNGNDKYTLNNFVTCMNCNSKTNNRFVGFNHTNGSGNGIVYERYKCRKCGKYIKKDMLDFEVKSYLDAIQLDAKTLDLLKDELRNIWMREEEINKHEVSNLKKKANELERDIEYTAAQAIERSNTSIKEVLIKKVERMQAEILTIGEKVHEIESTADTGRDEFLDFAIGFISDLKSVWFSSDFSKINRDECKQLLFPRGFYLSKKNKVYTPEISPVYTLKPSKKDTEVSEKATMVRVKRL